MKRQARVWRPDLLALISYVILSLAYLWPLARHFGTEMAGDGFDRYVFQWTNWWVKHSLSRGLSPYHTEVMFYPEGVDLHFLSFSWLNTFVWWPLQAVIGDLAAYNFTVWWSWPLAGFGAYLLALEVFGDRRGAFIAGLIYAYFPYHFAQRNHLNLLSLQWIPFSLLFLLRATREGRWMDGCISGLFFAFSGLSGWHLMTLSGMLGGIWVLYAWITKGDAWSRRSWRAVAALIVTVGVITGPFVTPIVREQLTGAQSQDPYLGREGETQTDLIAYVIPNLYHPLWGDAAAPFQRRFLRNKDHAAALGYVPLALGLYGIWRSRKDQRIRFWAIGLLVFWLLALGPFPRINGAPYPSVPLPYRLVGWSFPVRSLRNPERFNILVALCLALIAGGATEHLLSRLSNGRRRWTFCALAAVVLLEYWSWPFPTRPRDVPAGYRVIASARGQLEIVDLPISNDLAKRYMAYQTMHERPTVTGHVSRPPADAYAFIESNDLLRSMWQGRQPDQRGDPEADFTALAQAGVGYVIIHRDELTEEALTALRDYAPVPPLHADDRLLIYATAINGQPGP